MRAEDAKRSERAAGNPAYATTNGLTREQAEPWTIKQQRAAFLALPTSVQAETIAHVERLLADEVRSLEFSARIAGEKRPGSALTQLARQGVYGPMRVER